MELRITIKLKDSTAVAIESLKEKISEFGEITAFHTKTERFALLMHDVHQACEVLRHKGMAVVILDKPNDFEKELHERIQLDIKQLSETLASASAKESNDNKSEYRQKKDHYRNIQRHHGKRKI
jgi:hypothetical protein